MQTERGSLKPSTGFFLWITERKVSVGSACARLRLKSRQLYSNHRRKEPERCDIYSYFVKLFVRVAGMTDVQYAPRENTRIQREPGSAVLTKKHDHYTELRTARANKIDIKQ
jgi:hypothetical protein